MDKRGIKRQKPVSMVLNSEMKKNIHHAALLPTKDPPKLLLRHRSSIGSQFDLEYDFKNLKTFDVYIN
jgi:hypothetical protein